MNPRERLIAALNHREPDRVPIDLGGTDVSSICVGAYQDLMQHLGREVQPLRIVNVVEQLPALDEQFLNEIIQADTRQIREQGPSHWVLDIRDEGDYWSFVNEWGIVLKKPKVGGHYFDLVGHPLKEPSLEALEAFPWPNPKDPARWAGLGEQARALYENTDYALVVGCVFGGGLFEYPQFLRGMEEFFVDLVARPRFAEALLERMTEILIAAYESMLDKVGPYAQVVSVCDDLCGQEGPLISPDLYRRLVKPREARLIQAIKAKTKAKVLFHICGAAREFIPDLIEIGVDILNPVQVSARGMDTRTLKKEYGRDLVFWGGSCDTQGTLPFGSVEDVREETKRRIADLAPGGGFVFSPVHNIQDGVPPENVLTLFETAQTFGVY